MLNKIFLINILKKSICVYNTSKNLNTKYIVFNTIDLKNLMKNLNNKKEFK